MELPKTEQELNELIDARVKQATEELVSKHNGEMASLRTKHTAELDRVKKEASMSAEDLAKQKAEEMAQAQEQELNDLRAFKKTTLVKEKVVGAGLPSYFVNDSRLLSAEDGDMDKVIKTIKGEYEASLPKGTTHSTVVQTGGKTPDDKTAVYEKVGQAIGQIINK